MTEKTAPTKTRSAKSSPVKAAAAKVPSKAGDKAAATAPADTPNAKIGARAKQLLKSASERERKGVSTAIQTSRDVSFRVIDTQRAIWLAGLGAFAQASIAAGKQGEKTFQALVKAGEAMESRAKEAVDSSADRLKQGIGSATDYLGKGFERARDELDKRIEQALGRMGVPNADAFKQLYDRMNELAKAFEKSVRRK